MTGKSDAFDRRLTERLVDGDATAWATSRRPVWSRSFSAGAANWESSRTTPPTSCRRFSPPSPVRCGDSSIGPQGSFRGWLWMITRNKLTDWQRQQRLDCPCGGRHKRPQSIGRDSPAAARRRVAGSVPARGGQPLSTLPGGGSRLNSRKRTWEAFWRSAVGGERTAEIAKDLKYLRQCRPSGQISSVAANSRADCGSSGIGG